MQVPAGAYTDTFGDALADDASGDAPGDELADPDAHGARHQDPRFMIQANFLKYLQAIPCCFPTKSAIIVISLSAKIFSASLFKYCLKWLCN